MGGAQHFLVQLISGLPPERFECSVVVGKDGGGALRSALPANIPYFMAENLWREPNFLHDIASLFELRKIYKAQKPDIIFLNSSKAGFNGSWAASALPGRLPNTTVIYRIGGWSFNDPQPYWKRIFSIILEKVSDSWKDYIIVNNRKDFEDARRFKISPKKELRLIHNGIDPYTQVLEPDEARIKFLNLVQTQRPSVERLRSEGERNTEHSNANVGSTEYGSASVANLFQTKFIVGTIANFYPTKGLETLLEAIPKIKSNASFIIIGDGALRPELEKKIQAFGISNRVYLAGRIADAAQYLRAFSVFVLPSLKEGFPWSILEAMTAKVSVIASSVGAIPEIIEQGKNGLVFSAGNSDQLAQAVDLMLSDENLRKQCAIEGHQTILHRFSLRKMLDEYEKLLS